MSNRRLCTNLGVSSSVQVDCTEGSRATKRPRMNNRRLCVDQGLSSSGAYISDSLTFSSF